MFFSVMNKEYLKPQTSQNTFVLSLRKVSTFVRETRGELTSVSDGVTRVSRDSAHWEDTFVFSETIGTLNNLDLEGV